MPLRLRKPPSPATDVQDQLLQDSPRWLIAGLESEICLQGSGVELSQMLSRKMLALGAQLATDSDG